MCVCVRVNVVTYVDNDVVFLWHVEVFSAAFSLFYGLLFDLDMI